MSGAAGSLPALLAFSQPQREADTLLTFFTPDTGALHVRARGLQRAHSKLAFLVQPADELQLTLAAGRLRTPLLTGVSVGMRHPRWRAQLNYLALYWLMLEAAVISSAAPAQNEQIFTLIVNLLRSEPAAAVLHSAAAVFALKVLALHGLLPDLRHCALDGHPLAPDEPVHLLPSGEGLVGRAAFNQHYARSGGGMLRLAPRQLQRWQQLLSAPLLEYPLADCQPEDAALAIYLLALRLGELAPQALHSLAFLQQQWHLPTYAELLRAQVRSPLG